MQKPAGGWLAAFLTVALSAQQATSGQDQSAPPRLRTGTSVIEVDARVVDRKGQPMVDLNAEDFEILDNAMPQRVTVFKRIELPAPNRVPALTANPTPAVMAPDPASVDRAYLILVDDLHIAAQNGPRVKAALRQFVDLAIGVSDRAALLYTSGRGRDVREFTSDRRLLQAAAEEVSGLKLRSVAAVRAEDPGLNTSGRLSANADGVAPERTRRAEATLRTLQQLAAALQQVPARRKAVLFVSEGPEFEVAEVQAGGGATQWSVSLDLANALASLSRANVAVYPLDPRGVAVGDEDLIHASSVFETQGVGVSAARAAGARALAVLQVLSENTGGTTLLWRNNLKPAFDQMVRDLSAYYLLGYEVPVSPAGAAASYHRLEVKTRRPGARVIARHGYYASPAGS